MSVQTERNSLSSSQSSDVNSSARCCGRIGPKGVLRVALLALTVVGVIMVGIGVVSLAATLAAPGEALGQGTLYLANGLNMNALGFSQFFLITGTVLSLSALGVFLLSLKRQ